MSVNNTEDIRALPNSCNGFKQSMRFNSSKLFETLFNKNGEVSQNICIKHPEMVRRKLSKIISLGKDNLQVISDFDWTLSKFLNDGELNPTCHGIFEQDPEMTTEARNRLRMLRQTYSPVEIDPHIPLSMKIPFMEEWWDFSHKVMIDSNIHRDTLRATVNSCNLRLRDRVLDFFTALHNFDIPILVFSAGIGDIIKLLLERFDVCYDNVMVVSNFMEFNEEGLLVGFQEPIIHTFNKTVASVASTDFHKKTLSQRQCIILLGDSSHDPHMADGLIDDEEVSESNKNAVVPEVLKIGFLNTKVEALLERYMEIYDIVLINDGTFELPLDIVNSIASPNNPKTE